MRKWWWYAEVYVGTETKFGEKWTENGAVDGDVAARGLMSGRDGRMSGVPDVRDTDIDFRALDPDELRVEGGKSGKNSEEFVDGNWGKDGGKLDLPETHEIHGSNPTKLHHTNKSQKKLGQFLWGNFRIRKKINKTRLENTTGRLRNRDQRGS